MKLIKADAPPAIPRIYRSRVDSLWLGGDLEKAEVVTDEYAVLRDRRGTVLLDRPCPALGGSRTAESKAVAEEFSGTINEAVLHLYDRMMARAEAAYSNGDVISGKIIEAAAVLQWLN